MKRITFLLLFFTQILIAQDFEDQFCKGHTHAKQEASHYHQLMNFQRNMLTDAYDVKYHKLYLELDPAVFYVKGSVTTYFMPKEDGFQQINFDLSDSISTHKVIYHGNVISDKDHVDNNLEINLPSVINKGTLDSIVIEYEGVPAEITAGFGAFIQDSHKGIPVIWTLSEPYGAREWWPCKQDLSDKIDSVDIVVKTPKAYRAGSNGLLVAETEDGANKIYHWKHRYPITAYLVAVAVTNYEVYSDFVPVEGANPIEVLNYVYPESVSYAKSNTDNIVEMMTLFNELFGLYPFATEKYGHAQFGWGGGMEHQTMSFMGNFSYSLQAHELAHQWFGDKITCGSWEDIWVNEGFATYLQGLTVDFLKTEDEWMNWKAGAIGRATSSPSGSVFVRDTTSVNRIFSYRLTYMKGAMLVHMLRWKVGDDDFFQALKNYMNDPKLAFSYARASDVKRHLEAQSGQDLTEFFKDWYYGEGYPSYTVEWSENNDKLGITLTQKTSHHSVDFFEMPVPIGVQLTNGTNTIDTTYVLNHEYSGQAFTIDIPDNYTVNTLTFDPELWIVSRDNEVVKGTVSTSEIEADKALIATLNPSDKMLHIVAKSDEIEQIHIYDTAGKLIYQQAENTKNARIQTANWEHGVYIIRCKIGENTVSKKIVKS